MSKDIEKNISKNSNDNFKEKIVEKEDLSVYYKKKKKKLKKKILKIKKEFNNIKDSFLRARAEIENNKRRFEKDINNIHKYALYKFAKSLLPIKDSLESSLKVNVSSMEIIKNGINLTLKQLSNIFKENNFLKIFPNVGEDLDPMKHQAISIVYTKQKNNTIIKVLQCGYILYERLLRPALVVVSKKKK